MKFSGKENVHKDNKSHRGKSLASQSYNCDRCHGVCIFSRNFFEKYPKSAAFRAKLDEKFFAKEFEYIRSFIETEPKSSNQTKIETNSVSENKTVFTVFDLLKKFHSLEKYWSAKARVLHCDSIIYSEKRADKLNRFDSKKINEICRCCLMRSLPKKESRQKRHSQLIFDNLGDIRFEC